MAGSVCMLASRGSSPAGALAVPASAHPHVFRWRVYVNSPVLGRSTSRVFKEVRLIVGFFAGMKSIMLASIAVMEGMLNFYMEPAMKKLSRYYCKKVRLHKNIPSSESSEAS